MMRGIGFLTTPIFARLLSQSEFGRYSNYTSWLGILTILASLNLEASLITAKTDFRETFDEYIGSMMALGGLSGVFWIALISVFPDFFGASFGMDRIYMYSMFAYILLYMPVTLFLTREKFLFRYQYSAAVSLAVTAATSLLSVVLALCWENGYAARVVGTLIPVLVAGTLTAARIGYQAKRLNTAYWRYALRICLPYIPHLLSLNILSSIDRIMINQYIGETETALYSLAYTCGTMISILASSINNAFAPWLAEKLESGQFQEARAFSKVCVFFFGLAAVLVVIISPEILYILGGKAYFQAVYVMPPVALGCVCQFVYTMFVNVEQCCKKTAGMAMGSAAAASLNVVLNWICIPRFGYISAAYTTLAGYGFLLLIHMWLVKRIGYGEIYDYRWLIRYIAAIGCAALSMNACYGERAVRYGLLVLAILFVFIWIYRKRGTKTGM